MPGASSIPDTINARAVHLGTAADRPEAAVNGNRYGATGRYPDLWLTPGNAGHLAVIVEMLAGATPDQHRELAAAIRQAAAVITGAPDARASR